MSLILFALAGHFLLACGVIGVLAVAYLQWRSAFPARPASAQGRELNPVQDLGPEETGDYYLRLTRTAPELILGERARLQHTEIIGSSGTGKTYHAILPMICQDIQNGAGLINMDCKSNMRDRIASYAYSARRASDFYHLDLADPSHSMTYNPLAGEDPTEIANRVWTALYQDDQTPTPFYRENALSYCRLFFGICKGLNVLPTLAQLQACVADQEVLEGLVSRAPESEEGLLFKKRYLEISSKDYSQTFIGFMNKLAPLATGPFSSLLNTSSPQIDMRKVVEAGQILNIGLATDRYPSDYKIVSTLILMDLQSKLSFRFGAPGKKAMFLYMDEFGDLVYPKVRDLIAKAREANVGVIVAHQAFGDLKAHGAAFADSVFASTSNKIIFRVGSSETAEQLAKLAGTKPSKRSSVNYGKDILGSKIAKSATESEKDEFLFPPNDLLNLGVGEAMLIIQRQAGRELHQGVMGSAPAIKPMDPNQFPPVPPPVHYAALNLNSDRPEASLPSKAGKAFKRAQRQAVLDVLSGKKRDKASTH